MVRFFHALAFAHTVLLSVHAKETPGSRNEPIAAPEASKRSSDTVHCESEATETIQRDEVTNDGSYFSQLNSWVWDSILKAAGHGSDSHVEKVIVDVLYHVVESDFSPSFSSIRKQHALLNQAFGDSSFQFQMGAITWHEKEEWYDLENHADDLDMKQTLRKGGKTTLNVFISKIAEQCGYSSSPEDVQLASVRDGVVLNEFCFTGPISVAYIHQVAHWLGLSTSISGGSTRVQSQTDCNMSSTHIFGSCPVGTPTVNNMLEYVELEGRTHFTQQQNTVMLSTWRKFRNQA